MSQGIHTIVIGSGISGMAAASELAKSGNTVVVLEGNGYIGGRTKSIPVKLANQAIFKFDEGASWIHGSSKQHPITELSQKMGNVNLVMTDDDSIINYDKSGQTVGQEFQADSQQYEKLLEQGGEFDEGSLYDAFQQLNPSSVTNKYFMYSVSNDIEFQTSAPIQDLSAKYGQDDDEIEGDQMLVTSGYQAFPQFLAAHEKIKVLTNHQVVEVSFDGQNNKVKCSNGQTFEAPNIIVSVPIGALKSNSIRFNPQLPSWKQEAIQKIHFGNVCKILIVLKNKLINKEQHYIGVIQDNVQKRGSATYFLNLSGLAGLPALMTFGLGANADQLEFMPENQLKELIASRLRAFADKSFSVNDFDIKRTSWRGNPNFRGTYSYSGVETRPEHWENMAKPIFERNMYFCGEHTHSRYRGTVHGAYLSGIDSASCILQQINEEAWEYLGGGESENEQQKAQGQQESEQESEQSAKNQDQSEENKQEKRKERKQAKGGRKVKKQAKGGRKERIQVKGGRKEIKQAKSGKKVEGQNLNVPKVASPQCCQIC